MKKRILSILLVLCIMLSTATALGLQSFAIYLELSGQDYTDEELRDILYSNPLYNETELDISNNPRVTDIWYIFDHDWVPELETLDISGTGITELPEKLLSTTVTTLRMNRTSVRNLEALSIRFPNLKELNISDCGLTSLSGLNGLENLERLRASDNALTTLADLPFFPNIRSMNFSNNAITNLNIPDSYSGMNLGELYLRSSHVQDISSLSKFSSVRNLDLQDNNISDISALGNYKSISSIYLNNNNISDISPLNNLESISSCYLQNNNISDVSSLRDFKATGYKLDISNNPASDCLEELEEIAKTIQIDVFIYAPFKDKTDFDLRSEDFDQTDLKSITVDNAARTIEIYTAAGVRAGFYLNVVGDKYNIKLDPVMVKKLNAVSGDTNRYLIRNLVGNNLVETTAKVVYGSNSDPVSYAVTVHFDTEVLPHEYLRSVYGHISEQTIDGQETIVITQDEGRDYVGLHMYSFMGYQASVVITEEMRLSEAEHLIRVYPNGKESVDTTISIRDPQGTVTQYPLRFAFVKTDNPITPETVKYVNVKSSAYDSTAKELTLETESNTFVRMYKNAGNNVYLSIDTAQYDYIDDYGGFYQINKKELSVGDGNTAIFEIRANNGETIQATVYFPDAGKLNTKKLRMGNAIASSDTNRNVNLTIKEGKTYITLYKEMLTGDTLSVTSESRYVEERDNCYILRYQAAGEAITLSINNSSYTINLAKAG